MESINFFKVLKSAFEQYPAIYLKSTFTLSFSNTALWALIAGITFLITETILPKRFDYDVLKSCLLYTSPSPRDRTRSRMPSSA